MANNIGRREFISAVGGAAVMWPFAADAQQTDRVRRIGVLIGLANDAEAQARVKSFEQGLEMLGWSVGRNLRIEYRFAEGDADRTRSLSKELVDLQCEVLLAHSTPVATALHQATRTIPIVFVVVSDPIGSGLVDSVARPGGNVTGFTNLQATITGKYLQMLTEIVPQTARVALMFNPTSATSAGSFYSGPFKASALAFHVESLEAQVHNPAEIEQAMEKLGSQPGNGLVVMPDNFTTLYREIIISLAARYRLPTIYPYRYFAEAGGLLSYGVDVSALFGRAATYVDRILRGAKPADLPVQAPTKFELVINMKTAKALGLTVPPNLLATADEVIE